jgi:hypothetical protein
MIWALMMFLAFADLDAVKSEPDLNHRSELALNNAEEKIDAARKAYEAGDTTAEAADVQEVADSVTLCYAALQESHTAPRKSRYYKRAELRITAMMRRLTALRDEVSFESRANVETALKKLSDIHDEVLSDIMSKKK